MENTELERRTANVAAIIAPKGAPPWLADFLLSWVSTVFLDRGVHAKQPTKTEMRERLVKVSNAAATLRHALQDPPIREFLELEGRIKIENDGGLDKALGLIAKHAIEAAESSKISLSEAKAKQGRGKALPTGATSPKTYCALIISELWKALHDEYPAPRNIEAARAADAFWVAAGGTAQRDSSEPFSSWRYHFREARPPAMEEFRKEIRRHVQNYEFYQRFIGGK